MKSKTNTILLSIILVVLVIIMALLFKNSKNIKSDNQKEKVNIEMYQYVNPNDKLPDDKKINPATFLIMDEYHANFRTNTLCKNTNKLPVISEPFFTIKENIPKDGGSVGMGPHTRVAIVCGNTYIIQENFGSLPIWYGTFQLN
jgi:hypothetical protein